MVPGEAQKNVVWKGIVSQFSSSRSRFDPSFSQRKDRGGEGLCSMRSHKAAECSGCSTERIFRVQTMKFVGLGISSISPVDRKGDRRGAYVRTTKASDLRVACECFWWAV